MQPGRSLFLASSSLALMLVTAGSHPASADITHWSLGPHLGWARTTDSHESSLTMGLASRFKFAEVLGAELAVDWINDEIESGDIKTMPVQLSGLIYVVPHYVHGTVGVGWYKVDASLKGLGSTLKELNDNASDAGLHLGAGVEIPVGSRTNFTAEGRYAFLGYDLKDVDQTIHVDADFLNVVAGLQFYVW